MRFVTSNKSLPGMKRLTIMVLLAMTVSFATGQPLENEYPSTLLEFSVGFTYPITTLETGEITDYLIGYRSRYNYTRYLSGTQFFNKRFGLNFQWQECYSEEMDLHYASFFRQLEEWYDKDYYYAVYDYTKGPYNTFNRDFKQGYLGLVYRMATERYFIHPQLNIGLVTFSTIRTLIRLKEKNSNLYQTIEYDSDKYQDSNLSLACGVTAGIRVFTRFHLTAECRYSWFRPDFTYTITEKNLFERTASEREISYTRNMHALTIGFGLMYELNYRQIR